MPGCLSLFSRRSRSPSPPPARRTAAASSPSDSSAASEKAMLDARFPSDFYGTTSALPRYTPSFAPLDPSEVASLEDAIDGVNSELRAMSLKIQELHELGFKEYKTHDLMCDYMEKKGFTVTRHAYGMDTAWEAVFELGSGGRCIGFNSEMDALPGIGHACGHNLIAIAGVAAALAVAAALKEHKVAGKVILLGTPSEEGGGGKCILIERGAYKPMDACLMVHPSPKSSIETSTAVTECLVKFVGHTAHAAAAPWEALNAQDAAVLAYNNISALRQQIHPSQRVHGILFGQDLAQNIIPDIFFAKFGMRALTVAELEVLKPRVVNCFKAAALATGCEIEEIKWEMYYKDQRNNMALADVYCAYQSESHGVQFPKNEGPSLGGPSTDFGDVTYALPGLQPGFGIPTVPGGGNHTALFTKAAATPEAHKLTLNAAKGIAVAGYKVVVDAAFAKEVKAEWAAMEK